MKEFIDKLMERLEKRIKENTNEDMSYKIPYFGLEIALNIVNELAEEYKVSEMPTGWIADGKGIHKHSNADRIRAMNDEELAEFLGNEKIRDEHSLCSDFGNGCYYYCKKNHACHDNIKQLYIEWLQSEAE